ILDRVLLGGAHVDPDERARRENVFVVAAQCTQAAATCFCTSMGSGPLAEDGFDLALTEVLDGARHYFVVEVGSAAGAEVLGELPHAPAREQELGAARERQGRAVAQMGREL